VGRNEIDIGYINGDIDHGLYPPLIKRVSMRLLILSESIDWTQRHEEWKFVPPNEVHLVTGDLNNSQGTHYSVFDYDVAIIHIHPGRYNTLGYCRNIPKVVTDTLIALKHGRSIICLPQSDNFVSGTYDERGKPVYDWLEHFGVVLKSNFGVDIKPSGAGKAYAIQEYLKCARAYFQIVFKPEIPVEQRLAVVDDTDIVIGLEYPYGRGTLVILPPPDLSPKSYKLSMSRLADVAMRYYERNLRRVSVGDTPDWVEGHLVPEVITLNQQIKELTEKKSIYDRIAYVLYGTGDDLVESVVLLLSEFGLEVKHQPHGANIDLTAIHPGLNFGFALEVTGTKGVIRKDSNKVGQAWQYLTDRVGTPQENDRLLIIANAECHLAPEDRKKESFTPEVVKLLGGNEVLLVTTLQLYEEWKSVHEGHKVKEDIVKELHSQCGLYTPQ
jgi:hypothetical protein